MPNIQLKNTGNESSRLRVFIDSDVLFAGSASLNPHSASNVILQMSEITLIKAIVSEQVITEVTRNLMEKIPEALPAFRKLAGRCVEVVPDPSLEEVNQLRSMADWKDVPILAAAKKAHCKYLLTFNTRDYRPGVPEILVLKPGEFLQEVRMRLAGLDQAGK